METDRFILAVYVDNAVGVLTRVTAMFTRRGFNIDALTVGETEDSAYSRITISMRGNDLVKQQLINQLKKLCIVIYGDGNCPDQGRGFHQAHHARQACRGRYADHARKDHDARRAIRRDLF